MLYPCTVYVHFLYPYWTHHFLFPFLTRSFPICNNGTLFSFTRFYLYLACFSYTHLTLCFFLIISEMLFSFVHLFIHLLIDCVQCPSLACCFHHIYRIVSICYQHQASFTCCYLVIFLCTLFSCTHLIYNYFLNIIFLNFVLL